jgi:hypothetical protein
LTDGRLGGWRGVDRGSGGSTINTINDQRSPTVVLMCSVVSLGTFSEKTCLYIRILWYNFVLTVSLPSLPTTTHHTPTRLRASASLPLYLSDSHHNHKTSSPNELGSLWCASTRGGQAGFTSNISINQSISSGRGHWLLPFCFAAKHACLRAYV